MENPIIVPFDLNTARKIKSGEIEGSVLIGNIKIEFVVNDKMTNMTTRTYEGVQHGDWVRCVLCGAQMLLPCGADKCPECGENGTLRWVDEEKQEMDAKDLDCLGYVRELRIDDYLSPTTLEEIAEEIKKKVNRG